MPEGDSDLELGRNECPTSEKPIASTLLARLSSHLPSPCAPHFPSWGLAPLGGFCMCLLERENITKTSAESPGFEVSTGNCSRERSRVSVLLVDGLFVWFSVTAAASAAGPVAWHCRKLKCPLISLHFSTQNKGL